MWEVAGPGGGFQPCLQDNTTEHLGASPACLLRKGSPTWDVGAHLPLISTKGSCGREKSPPPLWAEPQLHPPAGLGPSLRSWACEECERCLLQLLFRLKVTHSGQRSDLIDGEAGTGQRTTGDMDKRKIWVTKRTQCLETREVCLELGEILQWQPEPPLSKLIGWSKLIITGWLRKSQERQKNTIPFPFRWKLQYKPFYC